MLIYRGAVTHHPHVSSSAPGLSPYYRLPPTSVSSGGVSELQAMLAPLASATQLQQQASTGQDNDQDCLPAAPASDDPVAVGSFGSMPLLQLRPTVLGTSCFLLAFAAAVFLGGCLALLAVSEVFQSLEPTDNENVEVAQLPQPIEKELVGLREAIGGDVGEAATNYTVASSTVVSSNTTRKKHPRSPQVAKTVDQHRRDSSWSSDSIGSSWGVFSSVRMSNMKNHGLQGGTRVPYFFSTTQRTSARQSSQQQNLWSGKRFSSIYEETRARSDEHNEIYGAHAANRTRSTGAALHEVSVKTGTAHTSHPVPGKKIGITK